MTLRTRIAGRWDIDPDTRTALPFRSTLALLNVKRMELACVLVIVNDAIELLQGHTQSLLLFEIPVALVIIALVQALRHARSVRTQEVATATFIVVALLCTQWAIFELAVGGTIHSGYLVRLLTITLLFVLPPRTWAVLLAVLFASYGVLISGTGAHAGAKLNAIVGAATVTAIAQVSGWLIYAVRRSDHEQRSLIESQNRRLAAQNAELDQLMAITAHDLRSPLHGLRNLFDLALRRASHDPSLPQRVLAEGIASLDAMLALVTRLLHAHQAEHGPLAEVIHDDLREHVRAAAQRISPLAEVHDVKVDLSLPDAALGARIDGGALAQILDNLLANAVRYSQAGEPLRLAARASAGDAILTVEDRGPGIDPALRPGLFGKFHRGASAHEADAGKAGTGMGLFIAATCAARIGATLSYRPASPRGSVFELSVPLAGGSGGSGRAAAQLRMAVSDGNSPNWAR